MSKPQQAQASLKASKTKASKTKASKTGLDNAAEELFFIPDLCNPRAVVFLILFVEGLVGVLILMEKGLMDFSLEGFGLVSLFVQWVALLSVGLICQLRRFAWHLKPFRVSLLATSIIMLTTGLVSIAALWVQHNNETGLPLVIDWAWLTRNLLVAAILSAFLMRYFYVQSQWRLRSQAELKARLAALQARIRPHFFFNTLNTVASLIMIDPDKAENMLLDLAQLFRVVLQADAEPTLLETELELGRRYLDIEATRLGDRVVICWQLPASIPPIKLPILTLQPLLENAIYHGIQPLGYGGEILIQLNFEQSVWVLEVINDCPDNESSTRSGIAHENIRARLGAHFGSRSDLKTHRSGHKYLARLTMPPPEE